LNRKKIKIYSLTTTYPESVNSTKPRFVHALNKELVNLGAEVIVICPHLHSPQTKIIMDSVHIQFFKYLPQRYEIGTRSIPDSVKTFSGKLKVLMLLINFFLYTIRTCSKEEDYILHGNWAFPGGYIAYLISRFKKKKFIVTVHGSEIPLLEKFSFFKKMTVNSMNNSSNVITSNNYLKNKLVEMGVHSEKIVLIRPIPNFVEHKSDSQTLTNFREKFTSEKNKIILCVGRLTEVKGIEYLIRSISLIKTKKIHLLIVGEGVLLEELKKLTKSLEIEDKVTFFGAASRDELSLLYDISDVFVLSSIVTSEGATEGTGLVILEAMESGLPVIASSVGGITETIQHEQNGLLVNEKNPSAIAKSIERILSDNSFKDKLIKNSKITVNEFNPNTIAQKYQDIFKRILKNS